MADETTTEMTVDELARRAGSLTSTVRLYQTRGLLAPPRRQGRVAFYGEAHLARLRLIEDLQARGFSLAGIKELLDGWDSGASLPDLLGLRHWHAAEPLVLTPAELVARLGDITLTPALLLRVVELGLARLDGDKVIVTDPRFLAVGAELIRLGVPPEEVLDEYTLLRDELARVASRFVGLFERHLWDGLADGPLDAVTAALDRLAPLAHAVVDAALAQALRTEADRFASHHLHPPVA